MRKFLAIALAAVCVFALCSCTPDESDIKEAFKENGYVVNSMDSIYAVSFGVDVDDVEYVLLAIGQDNSSTVYVVGFKDKKAAKEFYNKNKVKEGANFRIKRKGSVVTFGSEQGVELF
ncbi:MAG: hypothetical protein IKC35_02060 [Clostridia bacterium]|nr:hypothetical protein [Clostridia bacterium]